MTISDLAKEYNAQPAVVPGRYQEWVYSAARKVDVSNLHEMSLVRDLSGILAEFMDLYGWVGVSSNNIFWNGTKTPLSVIQVPDAGGKTYLTLINPEIKEYCGNKFKSYEGCGSFPGRAFCVLRNTYVRLVGTLLENQEFKTGDLEYGLKRKYYFNKQKLKDPGLLERVRNAWIVQHEYDHIKGIVLPQHAIYSFKESDIIEKELIGK